MISHSTVVFTAASFAALAEADSQIRQGEMNDPQIHTSPIKSFANKLGKMMGREHATKIAMSDGEASGPQWFTTDNPSYQSLIHNEYNRYQTAHNLGSLFCHTQSLFLCTHSDYCPDGAGEDLFAEPSSGALSADAFAPIQWAPMFSDEVTEGADNGWVQVDHYGEEGDGTCWPYAGWTRGVGGDVEEKWGEVHRKWILCCETMSEQEMWEMNNLPDYLGA